MTYIKFKAWAAANPGADAEQAADQFPKLGFGQVIAWAARFRAEQEWSK